MNPRAGDTVTSTKTTTSTNSTTTINHKSNTTGERPESSQRPESRAATRKRRQQTSNETRPEVKPPPEKSRRRAGAQVGRGRALAEQQRANSKSRIGDFFSSLASRIRRPRTPDPSMDQDLKQNSEDQRVECNVQGASKREGRDETAEKADSNKRRKIESKGTVEESRKALNQSVEVKSDTTVSNSESVCASGCSDGNIGAPGKGCDRDNISRNNEVDTSEQKSTEKIDTKIIACQSVATRVFEKTKDVVDFFNFAKTDKSSEDEDTEELQTRNEEESAEQSQTNDLENATSNAETNASFCVGSSVSVDVPSKEVDQTSTEAAGYKEKDPTSSAELTSGFNRCTLRSTMRSPRREDDLTRLRKTIQWLEENSRRLREDLATVRSELHEERRAAKVAKRELDTAIRDVRNAETVKYSGIISDLKTRLSQSPSRLPLESSANSSKADLLKDENHRREVAALKKRLTEAEATVQKLRTNSFDHSRSRNRSKENINQKVSDAEIRKLEIEVQSLRAVNKKLEERVHIAEDSARARAAELRAQHENHEAELSALQKTLRSDTIRLMDEIQSKNREIEKLEKLVNESAQINQKLRTKEDETMRKLRESERSHQIRMAPRIEEKEIQHDNHLNLCKMSEVEEEEVVSASELDRLRELAVEQQEVIEVLRQAVKERERKLEQLSNKRRKEEFYKQWLELEPVAEVEDEDDHQYEEEDSALSSAPPSLSPQPSYNINNSSSNANNGVTREVYESVLMENEELQTKLLEEQQELSRIKNHVQELEEALLQETRGSQNNKRALTEKLRDAKEREANLIAEVSELREQNELLEFRVLELEESPNPRESPDPADSGIVSPEPIHLYKEQQSKPRDRAVATVIPYTSTYSHPILVSDPQKAPLSLQESGIFEEELDEQSEDNVSSHSSKISSQSTQTEAPAGELLQEVQRLQELRARIQERASKVPPVSPVTDRKEDGPFEFPLDIVTPLRERVRDLEDRLSFHESERQVHKEREEELLDENYRLTERLYCLEAELKKLQEKLKEVKLTSDVETMTEESGPDLKITKTSCNESEKKIEVADTSRCQKLYQSAIQNLDPAESSSSDTNSYRLFESSKVPCSDCSELWRECDTRIHNLARTEFCLRQQIASLEHRESAFFETLRQADATWVKLEADYESKQREMTERLDAQVELNRALFEHLTKLTKSVDLPAVKSRKEHADVDENVEHKGNEIDLPTQTEDTEVCCKCSSGVAVVRTDSMASRVSTISRTSIKMNGSDEIDANDLSMEVATEAKEEMREKTPVKILACSSGDEESKQETEALISIDESSSDKKDKMAGAAWCNQATTRNGASRRKVPEAAERV